MRLLSPLFLFLFLFHTGPQTRRRHPIRRDGARRAYCARDLVLIARPANELLRLLDCVGMPDVWVPHLARV